jgi:hypothetical protein
LKPGSFARAAARTSAMVMSPISDQDGEPGGSGAARFSLWPWRAARPLLGRIPGPAGIPTEPAAEAAAPPAPVPVSMAAAITGTCVPGTLDLTTNTFESVTATGYKYSRSDQWTAAYQVTLTNPSANTADVTGFAVVFYDGGRQETGSQQAGISDTFTTAGQSLRWTEIPWDSYQAPLRCGSNGGGGLGGNLHDGAVVSPLSPRTCAGSRLSLPTRPRPRCCCCTAMAWPVLTGAEPRAARMHALTGRAVRGATTAQLPMQWVQRATAAIMLGPGIYTAVSAAMT